MTFPGRAKQVAGKIVDRYRRDGARGSLRYYAILARHFAHFLAYDRRLDRFESRASSGSYTVRPDEVVGPIDTEHALNYQAFARLPLYWSIAALGIDPREFSFVDYGSGRGRPLLAAATLPFRRVIGVEFAASLHQAAVENIRAHPKARIAAGEVVSLNQNALDFALPDGNLVIFVFNSFKGATLERVADRMEAAAADGRRIFLIYGNSDRVTALQRRPAFRRLRPPLVHRARLALLGTVPVDLFEVRTTDLPRPD